MNHSNLNSFSNFSVTRSCEFINHSGSLRRVNPVGIPAHSLLKWNVSLGNMLDGSSKPTEFRHSKEEFFKFDSSNISENFLNDDVLLFRVNEAIAQLESSLRSQSHIDGVYTDWCKILEDQMLKELPVIKGKNCQTKSLNSKKHRPSKPIPKSSITNRRDPLSYRGISLAPAMYKLYCSSWSDENHKLVDEQNGFRKRRSTTDHISSLVSIIDTRKKLKFKKAYDTINRSMLWKRLTDIGIFGKMFQAVKSLHTSVKSCVRVNLIELSGLMSTAVSVGDMCYRHFCLICL